MQGKFRKEGPPLCEGICNQALFPMHRGGYVFSSCQVQEKRRFAVQGLSVCHTTLVKTGWVTSSCGKLKPENLHWQVPPVAARVNGCPIPPTLAQKPTGKHVPAGCFLNRLVVKQQ